MLLDEVLASLNAGELAQRRFREIARVSGLVFQGYPGEKRSNKQLQASSSLFYEVFRKYDPGNQLLLQAKTELLAEELDLDRLQHSLAKMANHVAAQQLVIKLLRQPTPFSFPLMVERLREKLSNESMADRIARMVQQLEHDAGGDMVAPAFDDISQALALGKDTLASPGKRVRTSRRRA